MVFSKIGMISEADRMVLIFVVVVLCLRFSNGKLFFFFFHIFLSSVRSLLENVDV